MQIKVNVAKIRYFIYKRVENVVEKGEPAAKQHILGISHFPTIFSKKSIRFIKTHDCVVKGYCSVNPLPDDKF